MPSTLIDTNLLVYLYDPSDPDKQAQALRILNGLENSGQGCMSVQSLSEFISVAIRKLNLTPDEAHQQAELWSQLWPIFDITSMIVLEAARGERDHSLSYYDAQIWASARLNQISVIFSEDFNNGAVLEGVRFVNPFDPDFVLENWV